MYSDFDTTKSVDYNRYREASQYIMYGKRVIKGFEFFDSISVYTPEYGYTISDYTESMDTHFRDLRKWVKRASDLNDIFMVTTTIVRPLSGKDGKLSMVYQLMDRYNRRYVIRMPAKPVSNRDLPTISMEHDLPNLVSEIATAASPHLYLPWGYWFNELPELA